MAESYVKIKTTLNDMKREFNNSSYKYYSVKYYKGKEYCNVADDEETVFDVHLKHDQIGNRSIERGSPYTFDTLEKTLEKYVKEYKEEIVNKNYLYQPIKNNKYFVSENESYDIEKEVDNGYKVKSFFGERLYILTYGWQGYYYKDYDAFKNGNDVCYIPEYNYVNNNENCLIISEKDNTDDKYYRKDIIKEVREELSGKVYQDFFNKRVPQKLINYIASIVFDTVDWQHPSSYFYETEWDDTIKDYFLHHPKDLDKYGSEELKKELKEQEMVYGEI